MKKKEYLELNEYTQFGGLIVRRDGSTEIIVSFNDIMRAGIDVEGNVSNLKYEFDNDGLHETQRHKDIVKAYGLINSLYGFNDYSETFRDLVWEGNEFPYITYEEWVVLSELRNELKDFYFYKEDNKVYLVNSPEGDYMIELPFETLFNTLLTNDEFSYYTVQELLDFNEESAAEMKDVFSEDVAY